MINLNSINNINIICNHVILAKKIFSQNNINNNTVTQCCLPPPSLSFLFQKMWLYSLASKMLPKVHSWFISFTYLCRWNAGIIAANVRRSDRGSSQSFNASVLFVTAFSSHRRTKCTLN